MSIDYYTERHYAKEARYNKVAEWAEELDAVDLIRECEKRGLKREWDDRTVGELQELLIEDVLSE